MVVIKKDLLSLSSSENDCLFESDKKQGGVYKKLKVKIINNNNNNKIKIKQILLFRQWLTALS